MTDPTSLQGRVALVVGGAHDVGAGITHALLAAGATVAVCEPEPPTGGLPDGVRCFAADVQEAAEADQLVAAVVAHHGRLDVVVNGAGGSPPSAAATAQPSFSAAIVTRNLLAPLHVSTAANRVMQDQDDGGAIVNLGALSPPTPGAAAYGAAKAGVIHLTSSLAVEWAPRVRVNCVSAVAPGASTPVGTAAARDIGGAVAWLTSPAASYVSGIDLVVHGGGRPPAFLAAVAGP